jgi:hypothetical protein
MDQNTSAVSEGAGLDRETEMQAKTAMLIPSPLYIEVILWEGTDVGTVLFKDEFKQVKARAMVGQSTLKELRDDLNDMFKA